MSGRAGRNADESRAPASPFPALPPEIAERVAAVRAGSGDTRLEVGRAATGIHPRRAAHRQPKLEVDEISPAELRVLEQICAGVSTAAMAPLIFLSVETVKSHIRHMLARCGCVSRAQLAYRWGRGELAVVDVRGSRVLLVEKSTRDRDRG